MAVINLERKYQLIDKIVRLDDAAILDIIESALRAAEQKMQMEELVRPIAAHLTLEGIKKRQNYKGFDLNQMTNIASAINLNDKI